MEIKFKPGTNVRIFIISIIYFGVLFITALGFVAEEDHLAHIGIYGIAVAAETAGCGLTLVISLVTNRKYCIFTEECVKIYKGKICEKEILYQNIISSKFTGIFNCLLGDWRAAGGLTIWYKIEFRQVALQIEMSKRQYLKIASLVNKYTN